MADNLLLLKALLVDNWTPGNTGGVTPEIEAIYEFKRYDVADTLKDGGSVVLLYLGEHTQRPSGVNRTHINLEEQATIDVRCMVSRAQTILLRDEIKRIIGANFDRPYGTIEELEIQQILDLSNKSIKLWRFTFLLEQREFHSAR